MTQYIGDWLWQKYEFAPTTVMGHQPGSSSACQLDVAGVGVAGSAGAIGLGKNASTSVFLANVIQGWSMLVNEASVTSLRYLIGMCSDFSDGADGGVRGIYFRGDTSGANKLECITRTASTSTTTVTALAVSQPGKRLAIDQSVAGQVTFYSGGTLLATHTTNIPTGAVNFGVRLEGLSATAKTLSFGQVRFRYPPISFP